MFGEKEREIFEQNYRQWIVAVASAIAASIKPLETEQIKEILKRCEEYQSDPTSMYSAVPEKSRKRLDGLVGSKRLDEILLLSTDAVSFSPSIFSQASDALDYTIAMNRRFFFRVAWIPMITINQSYIERATDHELHFLLEHELTQSEMYSEHVRKYGHTFLKNEEKRAINETALQVAIERSGITEEERDREHELMDEIVASSSLVPKSYAETSLFEYLELNWDDVSHLGVIGKTTSEKEFEAMLSQEYGWIDFSHATYDLYLSGLKRELDTTYTGYGYS